MILIEKPAIAATPSYRARLAACAEDVRKAQRLRFEVFNVELNEGLAESHFNGLDADPFDAVCDHLLVENLTSGEVVGTYRLQSGENAAKNIGYYSEREFDFAPYEAIRRETIELGRACVDKDHRNFNVLHLLWREIARYAHQRHARYLVGCSSVSSQDAAEGEGMYQLLRRKHLVRSELRTVPLPSFALPATNPSPTTQQPPRLLRAYLSIGAKICGPPAMDREFGTTDFLTLLDLQTLPLIARAHFFP